MEITKLLEHVSEAASSPFSVVAYICVVAAWTYITIAQHRLDKISKQLKHLPESERASILAREYSVLPRKGLSAKQWLRARRELLFFIGFLSILFAVLVVTLTAISHYSE